MSPETSSAGTDGSSDEQISAFKAELMLTLPDQCVKPRACLSAQMLACEVATSVVKTDGNREEAKAIFSKCVSSYIEGIKVIDHTGAGCCVERTCRHKDLPEKPIQKTIRGLATKLLAGQGLTLIETEEPNTL